MIYFNYWSNFNPTVYIVFKYSLLLIIWLIVFLLVFYLFTNIKNLYFKYLDKKTEQDKKKLDIINYIDNLNKKKWKDLLIWYLWIIEKYVYMWVYKIDTIIWGDQKTKYHEIIYEQKPVTEDIEKEILNNLQLIKKRTKAKL